MSAVNEEAPDVEPLRRSYPTFGIDPLRLHADLYLRKEWIRPKERAGPLVDPLGRREMADQEDIVDGRGQMMVCIKQRRAQGEVVDREDLQPPRARA